MNIKLHSTITELVGRARMMLAEHGHLMPVCFIFDRDWRFDVIGCPWQNDAEKEASIIAIRGMAREKNATAAVFLAEAWHADLPGVYRLEDWDGTPASKQPNRREVVQVYVESLDGYWLGLAPITRDKGYPTFGELEWRALGERQAAERFQKILA